MSEEQAIVDEMNAQFGGTMKDIPERSSEQLPKQKVVLKVESATLNRSAASGRKQLTIATVILESDAGPENVGKKYKKNWGLETEENLQWLRGDMKTLELEPPNDPKAVLALCTQLTGLCFTAALVPNTDESFPPNCYINKGARRHELEGEGAVAPTAASGSDIA